MIPTKPIPQLTVEDVERFWSKVRVSPSGCWEWTGGRNSSGYGGFQCQGFNFKAHRISFYIEHGRDPLRFSLHRCDNPPCVNPDHLFDGSAKDNAMDRVRKGRQGDTRGERHGCHKLTEEDVLRIKQLYVPNIFGVRRIASLFGVTKRAVWAIINSRAWIHVSD